MKIDTNIAIQYTLVSILIIAALIWLVLKFIKQSRKANSPCCGCAVAEICMKRDKKSISPGDMQRGENNGIQDNFCEFKETSETRKLDDKK